MAVRIKAAELSCPSCDAAAGERCRDGYARGPVTHLARLLAADQVNREVRAAGRDAPVR